MLLFSICQCFNISMWINSKQQVWWSFFGALMTLTTICRNLLPGSSNDRDQPINQPIYHFFFYFAKMAKYFNVNIFFFHSYMKMIILISNIYGKSRQVFFLFIFINTRKKNGKSNMLYVYVKRWWSNRNDIQYHKRQCIHRGI